MKKMFVIFIVFSLFISSLCTIEGCKTEGANNKCTTCNDGYLLKENVEHVMRDS